MGILPKSGWFAAALLLSIGLVPRAQAAKPTPGTGSLDGKLTDRYSVPLGEATVTVRNLTTGDTQKGITGKNGSYRFNSLPPGEYRLEADVPDLGKGAVGGILVAAGHATRVQAALVMERPGPPLLEADLHELDPVSPAVATLIGREELDALPVATRDWQQFAAITPAGNPISSTPSHDFSDSFAEEPVPSLALGSSPAEESSSAVDGIPSHTGFHKLSGSAPALGESAVLSLEARSGGAPAESGRNPGGLLRLETARGNNGFHGQAFYRNRQSLWGARNPFTQWTQQTAPASGIDIAQFTPEPYSPANSRQTLGIGVGKEILRDRLFWFAALDAFVSNDPGVASVRHPVEFFAQPTSDDLTVFSARLALPGPALLEQAAAAYSAGLAQLATLLGPVPRSATQAQGFARIDWQATERQHLSVEGGLARENAPGGARGSTSGTYGSHSFGNSRATETWGQAQFDSFLTANLLNSLGLQWHHPVDSSFAQAPSQVEAPLLANSWGRLPQITTDSKYGFVLGKPARLGTSSSAKNPDESIFYTQDSLSWVRGAHLIRGGASFAHVADSVNTLANQTGTYSYADVLNFLSDEASFLQFGLNGVDNPFAAQHNCNATGRVTSQGGNLSGLGYLPCYAWYSQRIGPSNWHLSNNDLATFLTEQWQPRANLTFSVSLRAEVQQLPSPISSVANPHLPGFGKLPNSSANWGPRFGIAWSPTQSTVVRLGAGLYFGSLDNGTLLAALTQTGAAASDLNFFFKPTDPGAPPFPYVFPVAPQTVVTPGAAAFGPHFHNPEIDHAVFSVEQSLPGRWVLSATAQASLGRRLPVSVDANLKRALGDKNQPLTITYNVVDSLGAGPIKADTLTVPLYSGRTNLDYQQLDIVESRANSTYDAALVKLVHNGGHGFNLRAHYLYAHASDWNPNESSQIAANSVLDPADFGLEYGTSSLDIRHSAGATLLYRTPWKIRSWAGGLANDWSFATVAQFRSGLPFTMKTSGYLPGFYRPQLAGGHTLIEGVAPGINGSGGESRVYGVGSDGKAYNIGRNTYRYPATYTGDLRLDKHFDLHHHRELELLAESFNLFNHQNVTRIETTGYIAKRGTPTGGNATLSFMTGLTKKGLPSPTTVEFGKPLNANSTNSYRPREFQFGLRARF